MPRRCFVGLLTMALVLAACEEHPKKAAQGAPEYLHQALTGDFASEGQIAACFAATEGCFGVPPDPAMACAWRGVRLAARSPELSLADDALFRTACAPTDETFRQRAQIAQDSLTRRIYNRAPPPFAAETASAMGPRLYPSMEILRRRVNIALARAHESPLPAFGAPQTTPNEHRLSWRTCTARACLEGLTPDYGGGVFRYAVTVKGAPKQAPDRAAAAQLAAAGLEADAVADSLVRTSAGRGETAQLYAASTCWRLGVSPEGAPVASVEPGPCWAGSAG
ncbi:MAG: hypothetical protein ACHP84_09545 [Caulobacterales bacterium]